MPAPIIILVRPQLGENIGAAARAMANFGLSELRLVAPRDGWPNKRARETSSGAESIIDSAKVFPDFSAAVADIQRAYATTARPRDMEKRVVTPDIAVREMGQLLKGCGDVEKWRGAENKESPSPPLSTSPHLKIALVFGPERTGLENEEIGWCDTLITIPTSPEHSSLNLAQSLVVVGYEWWKHAGAAPDPSAVPGNDILRPLPEVAPKVDWQGLFEQLESYLDETNYYRVEDKKPLMWQNLKNMLLRGQWSAQEIRSFRGMLRAIWERRVKNRD